MEEKDTYKYHLKQGGRVILRSITYDLNRREAEHQQEFPGSVIKQIGRCTTRAAALKWERKGGKRRYKFHQKGEIIVIEVASIPTKNYLEIIEIRVPTRFYWNEDGSFDGIEFGEFKTTLQPWEEDMVNRCLEAIKGAIE